jgi:hypothetical protein
MGRALNPQEIHDVVEIITKGPKASVSTLVRIVETKRASLAAELRRYGEETVATKVESLPAASVDAIYAQGMKIAFTGTGTMLLKAFCLAAVEAVEGTARPLARKRRRAAT